MSKSQPHRPEKPVVGGVMRRAQIALKRGRGQALAKALLAHLRNINQPILTLCRPLSEHCGRWNMHPKM